MRPFTYKTLKPRQKYAHSKIRNVDFSSFLFSVILINAVPILAMCIVHKPHILPFHPALSQNIFSSFPWAPTPTTAKLKAHLRVHLAINIDAYKAIESHLVFNAGDLDYFIHSKSWLWHHDSHLDKHVFRNPAAYMSVIMFFLHSMTHRHTDTNTDTDTDTQTLPLSE